MLTTNSGSRSKANRSCTTTSQRPAPRSLCDSEFSRTKFREIQTSAGVWDGETLSIPAKDAAEFYITLILDPTKARPLPICQQQSAAAYDSTKRLVEQLRKLGLDRRTNYAMKAKATSSWRQRRQCDRAAGSRRRFRGHLLG